MQLKLLGQDVAAMVGNADCAVQSSLYYITSDLIRAQLHLRQWVIIKMHLDQRTS